MKKCLLFLMLIVSVGAEAQQLVINSTTYYGGSSGENIERILPTSDRGFLTVGSTGSSDGNIPPHPTTVLGRSTMLVTKHDSLGALQWAKVFGGTSNETAKGATQTADGGYAVVCWTNSDDGDVTARIGTGNLENTTDIWLLRLDGSGNLLWQHTYGSSQNEDVMDVLATPDGGFLILGNTSGSDSDAAYHLGPTIYYDWLLIKTDAQGTRQWRRIVGGTSDEGENGGRLFNAPGGGYYLVGHSTSHDSDLTEDNVWAGGVAPRFGPVFMRLSDSGQVQWCKRYGGSAAVGHAAAAEFDRRDTTLVVAGYTESNDFHFSGNHLKPNGQPSSDMFLVKVDKDGELLFSRLYGTGQEEYCSALASHPGGGHLLCGYTFPGPYGGYDIRLYQTSAVGDSLTTTQFGSTNHDVMYGALFRNGKWLLAGLCGAPPFLQGGIGAGSHPQGNLSVSQVEYWPTSINETESSPRTLILVPNPARGEVVCLLPAKASGTLAILSADGKRVLQKAFKAAREVRFEVSGLPAGYYQVVVTNGGGAAWSARLAVP